jgi:hypothetical protein
MRFLPLPASWHGIDGSWGGRTLSWVLMCGGVIFSSAADAESVDHAAKRLSAVLDAEVACESGDTALIGIFPFDEALIPLSAPNAFGLYEAFLTAVIDIAPACIRFIDGRGAFVTLGYLNQSGTLRESGQQQRSQIQESIASADYVLDGTVLESAGAFEAVFRLTAMSTGVAVGRVSFPVPERYRATSCGDGALPMETAMPRIAEALLQRTGPISQIMATGGRYAQSDEVTDAGRFLEDGLLAEISRASENVLTGAALRIHRDQVGERVVESGSYTLFLRYWPCDGDDAAQLRATLRSADGRDVTETRSIGLTTFPAGMSIRPKVAPTISGQLTVSPLLATIGTEISVLAAPPAHCNPFFFNVAPSGRLTPIPMDFFRRLDLGGGKVRYEISSQWDFGLIVQEDDEEGLNHLGYICQPEQVLQMSDLQLLLTDLLERRHDMSEGTIERPQYSSAYFQLSGFEIHSKD